MLSNYLSLAQPPHLNNSTLYIKTPELQLSRFSTTNDDDDDDDDDEKIVLCDGSQENSEFLHLNQNQLHQSSVNVGYSNIAYNPDSSRSGESEEGPSSEKG